MFSGCISIPTTFKSIFKDPAFSGCFIYRFSPTWVCWNIIPLNLQSPGVQICDFGATRQQTEACRSLWASCPHPTSTASPWPCCSSPQKTGSDAYLTVQKGSDKIRWLMLQKWALLSTKGAFINHDLSFSKHPWCGHLKPGEMNPSPRTQRNSSWDLGKQNCHILSHPCFLLIWACLLIAEQ